MDVSGSRLSAAVRRAYALLLSAIVRTYAATKTTGRLTASRLRAGYERCRRVVAPTSRRLVGPATTALFGRRADASAATLVVAAVLAVLTEAWVVTRLGWPTVRDWVLGTWYGTDPHTVVFLWAAALIALGAVSAAANSGLVPTTLLVSAPLFGVAFTRYGTRVGDAAVSLPDATVVGAGLALLFGVPLALAGFVVGVGLRRALRSFGGAPGRPSPGERA